MLQHCLLAEIKLRMFGLIGLNLLAQQADQKPKIEDDKEGEDQGPLDVVELSSTTDEEPDEEPSRPQACLSSLQREQREYQVEGPFFSIGRARSEKHEACCWALLF